MNIYPPGISLKKQAKLKIILLTKTFSGREKLLTVKTHGMVLAQIPLSAEDKKLIILTPDMGLIEAVAKKGFADILITDEGAAEKILN